MKRKNLLLAAAIQLAIASTILSSIHTASATTYGLGVKSGDFVKYGTVTGTFNSNVSTTPTPQFITDFQKTSSIRLDIVSTSGSNATEKLTQSFNNGTADKTVFVNWSVQSLTGNVSSINPFLLTGLPFLVAAGLTTSDNLCTGTGCSSASGTFNSTQSRTYAGASRTDNVLTSTHTINQTFGGLTVTMTFNINGYWDQSTGALMEVSFSLIQQIPAFGSSPAQKNTYGTGATATDTSLWSANILGLAPIVFYGIIGAIVAVVAIVAALMVMRMRKPKTPAMPSPSGTMSPPPPGQ